MGFSNIPKLYLGELEISNPVQGGMGVKISGARLASAVANVGGLGLIATVGLNEAKNYPGSYKSSSIAALKDEIRLARSMMNQNGYLGVNILHALTNYSDLVQTSIEEGVDAIISGAGVPLDMPKYLLPGCKTKLIPIVSSARLADFICKYWKKKYNYLPDAIVVEGPKAGGHLGFSLEQLTDENSVDFVEHGLERIIPEVVKAVSKYETAKKIPVIAAGGIFYGGDIKKFIELGASGVQMATRFVTTEECDAPLAFKQAYLNARKEDIIIIKSPVGMPARAIKSKFLDEVAKRERMPVNCPYHCLTPCDPKQSLYCIARALLNAEQGDVAINGFAFAGANAWRCKEQGIITVPKLFEKLSQEYLEGKIS